MLLHYLLILFLLQDRACAIAPRFSWDTLGNMTFFHSCNESGLFNERSLATIVKFPMVTIEKGQGFLDNSTGAMAEDKIVAQLQVIKSIDPTISTVMYMNLVIAWYFYEMTVEYSKMPDQWLYDSYNVSIDLYTFT